MLPKDICAVLRCGTRKYSIRIAEDSKNKRKIIKSKHLDSARKRCLNFIAQARSRSRYVVILPSVPLRIKVKEAKKQKTSKPKIKHGNKIFRSEIFFYAQITERTGEDFHSAGKLNSSSTAWPQFFHCLPSDKIARGEAASKDER